MSNDSSSTSGVLGLDHETEERLHCIVLGISGLIAAFVGIFPIY